MQYRDFHKKRIIEVVTKFEPVSRHLLRSYWLDVCDMFITNDSFDELIEELIQEAKIEIIKQYYYLSRSTKP
jgi:hypothetical protein